MFGENLTPYPAILLRTVLDEERMYASMLARVTYDLVGEALVPAAEQRFDVGATPRESPLGNVNPDRPYRKEGVDLFVLGEAHAPQGKPVKRLDLRFAVGSFEARAVAFGPRVWRKNAAGQLEPSEPEPFTSMSVGLEMGFGGSYEHDDLVAAYPLNPKGIGFYVDADAALGKPLPRLEDPSCLVKAWDDKPDPVGFALCQVPDPLRLREAARVVGDKVEGLGARAYNQAFPKMIAPRVIPGDRVVAEGFSPDGPISFVVPETDLVVRLRLGEKIVERVPPIEELGLDVARRQVFIGYRYPFRYAFVPEQLRTCTLATRRAA
ncbi:MAG TPA: DUF2169 domain-containing protein [Minicystis sp.]|nr:DUF2169 domain-containing protein [Minicystis sp.]